MIKSANTDENKPLIKDVTDDPAQIDISLAVIRESFRTVADEFGFTEKNCPAHTAFLATRQLRQELKKGLKCFGLFDGQQQVGFVGIEKYDPDNLVRLDSGETRYWLEKLAVLPSYRHSGYGAELVGFAVDYIRQKGGTRVGLGMMNDHEVLKNWYLRLGFKQVELKTFPHLPFTVCFMERSL